MAMGGSYQGTTGPKGWSFSKGSLCPPNGWGGNVSFVTIVHWICVAGLIRCVINLKPWRRTETSNSLSLSGTAEVNHPEVCPTLSLSHTISVWHALLHLTSLVLSPDRKIYSYPGSGTYLTAIEWQHIFEGFKDCFSQVETSNGAIAAHV